MTTRKQGGANGDAKHQAHSKDNLAPEAGMSNDTINIALNMLKAGISVYEEREQELIEWLWSYTFDELRASKNELIKAMGVDWIIIYRAFTGKLEDIAPFCEKIEDLKKRAINSIHLVSTVVTERIHEALDYARDSRAMVTITGTNGRGKTMSARHWARNNNHGRSKYVRVPSKCTRLKLIHELCRSCGISVNGKKTITLEARLLSSFGPRNVIIVDEAGHLMPRTGKSTEAIEFLRDLHDMRDCAIAMIFTDVYISDMKNGALADYFEQFLGRIKFEVEIPKKVLEAEVEPVVKSFHPDGEVPARLFKYALDIARRREGKLRTLFEDLERAQAWAKSEGRKNIRYEDLKTAVDWRKSGGVWPD